MNPLTKQDLQNAFQQLRDSILGATATRQDLVNAVNTLSQRSVNSADIQRSVDNARDKFMERLSVPIRQQMYAMQQITTQLEQLNSRLTAIENTLVVMMEAVKQVRTGTADMMHRTSPSASKPMFKQMFST